MSIFSPEQLKALAALGIHVTPDGKIQDMVGLFKDPDGSRDETPFADDELILLIAFCSALKKKKDQHEDVDEVLLNKAFEKLETAVRA